jgi:hypothetical protein
MMVRYLITFLFIVTYTISLKAQKLQPIAQAIAGKPYPETRAMIRYYLSDQNGFMIVKLVQDKVILHKLNKEMVTQRIMEYDNFPKGFTIEKILRLGKNYYILYSIFSKNQHGMYAMQIDMVKGELMTNQKELFTTAENLADKITPAEIERKSARKDENRYEIIFSDDSSRIAVCYRIKPEISNDRKNNETNGVWIFDDILQVKGHGNITFPYTEQKADVRARGIDSKGNFYAVLVVYKDESGLEKKFEQTIPNYALELLSYTSLTASPVTMPFNLDDKFLHSVSFNENNGRLICSGFYNYGQSNNGIQDGDISGIFTFPVSLTITPSIHPISLSAANEGESKFKQKSNTKRLEKNLPIEVENIELTQTSILSDGGILIQGERYTPGVAPMSGGAGPVKVSTSGSPPIYGNIILVKLASDGTPLWMRKLSKDVAGFEHKSHYLYSTQKNGSHYFFFIEPDEIFAYRINGFTGEGERELLADLKPLLKRKLGSHDILQQRLGLLPGGNGVILEASLKYDIGEFGETKPIREEIPVKIEVD